MPREEDGVIQSWKRGSHRQQPPPIVEIDTTQTSTLHYSHHNKGDYHGNVDDNQRTNEEVGQNTHRFDEYRTKSHFGSESKSFVQILPGSLLQLSEPPLEPTEEPPIPTHIFRFVFLGPRKSGKTTLIQSFLRRHQITTTTTNTHNYSTIATTTDATSIDATITTAATSTTTNNSNDKITNGNGWSVEYSKKDLAFWLWLDVSVCCRIQVWQITLEDRIVLSSTTNITNTANNSGDHDRGESPKLQCQQELVMLLQKADAIFLTVSIDAMMPSFHNLLETVQGWKQWIDSLFIGEFVTTQEEPTVSNTIVLLNKCDLLHAGTPSDKNFVFSEIVLPSSPMDWIQFGSKLDRHCSQLGFQEWYMTTATANNNSGTSKSLEDVLLEVIRGVLVHGSDVK